MLKTFVTKLVLVNPHTHCRDKAFKESSILHIHRKFNIFTIQSTYLYTTLFTSRLFLFYSANGGDSVDSDFFTPRKKCLGEEKPWFQQAELGSCSAVQGASGQTQAMQFNESVITRHKLMDRNFLLVMNRRRRIRRGESNTEHRLP